MSTVKKEAERFNYVPGMSHILITKEATSDISAEAIAEILARGEVAPLMTTLPFNEEAMPKTDSEFLASIPFSPFNEEDDMALLTDAPVDPKLQADFVAAYTKRREHLTKLKGGEEPTPEEMLVGTLATGHNAKYLAMKYQGTAVGISTANLFWLIGLFEGEASFIGGISTTTPKVAIEMIDYDVLRQVAAILAYPASKVKTVKRKTSLGKTVYRMDITGYEGYTLMSLIRTRMSSRRHEKINKVLEHFDFGNLRRRGKRFFYTDENILPPVGAGWSE